MNANWDKFVLLTWKNWTLQYRRPMQTLIEILAPVLFSILLVFVRRMVDSKNHGTINFKPFCPLNVSHLGPIADSPSSSDLEKLKSQLYLLCDIKQPVAPSTGFLSLLASQYILYTPNTTKTNIHLMDWFHIVTKNITNIKGFRNARDLELFYNSNVSTLVAFEIGSLGDKDHDVDIKIRFPSELRTCKGDWATNLLFPLYQTGGPRNPDLNSGGEPSYQDEQFLLIQQLITMALITFRNGLDNDGQFSMLGKFPYIYMRRYPHYQWTEDPLLQYLQTFVGMTVMLSFVYTCISTVKMIANEKEKQLKECMKIMGLSNWLHWTAWFVKSFAFLFVSVLLITILWKIKWYPNTEFSIFTYTDPTVVLVFLMLYICSVITFCFAISVFFSKANTAATCGGLIWYLSYVPYFMLQRRYDSLYLTEKLAISLGMNSAMAFGFQVILMFEGIGEGSQWKNLFSSSSPDDSLTLGHIFIMLIMDALIYMLIALYFEAIFPGKVGIQLPWHFLVTQWLRCGKSRSNAVADSSTIIQERTGQFETEPTGMKIGVEIRNLTKVYNNKTVVNNLSLNMYENQITVLLGHNGAGKTTTMSMLTGMIPPTSGTATINGHDIRTDMNVVRSSLGLCPQNNIIFDDLTVHEHLFFYSKLKGLSKKSDVDEEIKKYLKILDFEDKANSMAKTLSGGMKRKLCVGMALCGNSKVVLLDEPTSGMDPSARRHLWELLLTQKKGRTMLLTTHFMDEADLLGDRIAIMAGGALRCCGTSFFLKKKYGAGYNLIMEKSRSCVPNAVKELLNKYIPGIQIRSNVGSELSFSLVETFSPVFEEMLQDLESKSEKLGIRSFGISLTTLEEVFMKVGADYEEEANKSDINFVPRNTSRSTNKESRINIQTQQALEGLSLIKNQYLAMVIKRMISKWRSWILLLVTICIPVCFLIFAIALDRTKKTRVLPAMSLTAETYRVQHPITLLESGNHSGNLVHRFKKLTDPFTVDNITKYLIEKSRVDPIAVGNRYLYGASFEEKKKSHITAWFNNDGYHTAPISLGFVLNSIYQDQVKTGGKINFINYPLPYTIHSQFQKLLGTYTMGFNIAFNLGLGMTFAASYYILFVIKERVSKSKHLQYVSGAKVWIFWTATYFCDFCSFVITAIVVIISFIAFNEEGFNTPGQLSRNFLILLCFEYSVLPLIYIASYLFRIPSTGFTRLTMFGIFTGVMAFLVIQLMMALPEYKLRRLATILHWTFLLIPYYALCTGVRDNFKTFVHGKLCQVAVDAYGQAFQLELDACWEKACEDYPEYCCVRERGYFQWESPGIAPHLLSMVLIGTLIFIIIIMIDYRLIANLLYKTTNRQKKLPHPVDDEDEDVRKERDRIHSTADEELFKEDVLVLKDLTKYYRQFLAVNGVCLGVKEYECFGLLGVNGAGKTSTFKMMTGDVKPTYGEAWVKGLSIIKNIKKVQKNTGYCPQFDALLDDLTAKETIIIFALLRGMELKECPYVANKLSIDFDFHKHLNKKVKELSGGNKRKLSTVVALIGDPPIIYLDEPTTGMDTATKRYLWDGLAALRDGGKCIVLTSHSMEECEALCTRLAIMVNGNFKCLGSTQHLKSKFAEGYTITIKIKKTATAEGATEPANTDNVKDFISKTFVEAQLREEHQELLTYHIAKTGMPWSRMFGILENGKKELHIEDYSLGQSSLEQVFLTFTKCQEILGTSSN